MKRRWYRALLFTATLGLGVVKLHGAKHLRTQRVRARLITLYTALGWKDKLKDLQR